MNNLKENLNEHDFKYENISNKNLFLSTMLFNIPSIKVLLDFKF